MLEDWELIRHIREIIELRYDYYETYAASLRNAPPLGASECFLTMVRHVVRTREPITLIGAEKYADQNMATRRGWDEC